MGKYTEHEVAEMARMTVVAERLGDFRVIELYTRVSQATGMPPDLVRQEVYRLAGDEA